MTIGVLAVQGAFIEHVKILNKIGVKTFEIRKLKDLNKKFNALIIPGGESTAIGKLLVELKMMDPIRNMIKEGLPVFGTCAGMILLSKKILNESNTYFSLMDIVVRRNAYGRQLGSFNVIDKFANIEDFPMIFIRAPYIESVGPSVEILSKVDNQIVAAKEKNILVTSYHPELTNDVRIHKYFIDNFI